MTSGHYIVVVHHPSGHLAVVHHYLLIKFCLEFLRKNRLLEIKKEKNSKGLDEGYFATERLESICPKIGKVMMPFLVC